MAKARADKKLAAELTDLISAHLEGIKVEVAHSDRWDRMCATFTWKGFAGLLTEERFQRLTSIISEDFRSSRMKGFVWIELAPGETVDQALKSPRSEDVAEREGEIYVALEKVGFFEALTDTLDGDPIKKCPGDFSQTAAVLKKKNFSGKRITDAKLVFIRRGAYCDCQAITTIRAELQATHSAVT